MAMSISFPTTKISKELNMRTRPKKPLGESKSFMKVLVLGLGSVFLIMGPMMYAQEPAPGPKPKPACPDTGATSTATSQTTGATKTCTDGMACGFTVTVTHANWTCTEFEEHKCVPDSAAPQVQVYKWDCTPTGGGNPPNTTCTQSGPTNVTTTTGKKTVGC